MAQRKGNNMNEMKKIDTLMTLKDMCKQIDAPSYIMERMLLMPIGTSFEFCGYKIVRWCRFFYYSTAV